MGTLRSSDLRRGGFGGVAIVVFFASSALHAATLQFVDPAGLPFSYRTPGTASVTGASTGDMVKVTAANGEAGYEIERRDDRVIIGGWAYATGVGNFSAYSVGPISVPSRGIEVVGDGEPPGTEVTLYYFTKSFSTPAEPVRHTVLHYPAAGGFASIYDQTDTGGGWTRRAGQFSAAIGDVVVLRSAGNAGGGTADGRLQLSLVDEAPADPPIAGPPIPALPAPAAWALALGLVSAARTVGRASRQQSEG